MRSAGGSWYIVRVNRVSSRTLLTGPAGDHAARAWVTRVGILVLALGLLAAAPAQAAPDKRAKDAAQLYQQGKYQEAAEIYTKLRDEKQNPKFLCNLALCYLKMGYVDPGIETIKNCLGAAALTPDIRADYEALLRRLEAQRAAAGAPQEVVVPPAVDVNLVAVPEAAPYPGTGQDPAAAVMPPGAGAPAGWPAGNDPAAAAPPTTMGQTPAYGDPNNPAGYPNGYPGAVSGPPGYATPMPPGAAPMNPADSGRPRGSAHVPFGSYLTGAVGVVGTAMGIALVLHSQAIQQELDSSIGNAADQETLTSDLSRTKNGATASFIVGGLGLGAAVIWAIVAPSYTKPELAVGGGVTVGMGPTGLAGRF